MEPTVSVIIPAYNHEDYVLETVESVLNQTCSDFEIVVIDDGSKDGTVARLEQIDDPRLTVFTQQNAGTAAALNKGMAKARGQYFSVLNSDDNYRPERLEYCLDVARSQDADFVFTQVALIDEHSKPVTSGGDKIWLDRAHKFFHKSGSAFLGILNANFACTTSNFFFSRTLVERIGLYANLRFVNDLDFLFRAMAHGNVVYADQPTIEYRKHQYNTINEINTTRKELFETEMAMILGRFVGRDLQHMDNLDADALNSILFSNYSHLTDRILKYAVLFSSTQSLSIDDLMAEHNPY